MPENVRCNHCARELPLAESYIVRIDVYADPSMPPTTSEELAGMDIDQTFNKLIDQMKNMTADELQDGVHRRFEYRLCPACQKQFLNNPLGLPRTTKMGRN